MSHELQGKRIAVTGAFGALGVAVARSLQAAGARVAAIDRAQSPHAGTDLGAAFLIGDVDLGNSDAARKGIDEAAGKLGGLDALINIAGAFRFEKISGGDANTWDLLYAANLRSALAACQAALPHLGKNPSARIVNIGANAAAKASAGMGAYTASKAGVARLTEALADELKDLRITVNAILPSTIDTPANRADMPDADFERWVKPEQIAEVIVFLLSDRASAITGASIPVIGRV